MSAKALCSVGHFDAKHILLLIRGDNKRSVLVRMQLEIIVEKKSFDTPETQIIHTGQIPVCAFLWSLRYCPQMCQMPQMISFVQNTEYNM